jgi:tetratricopeptide (TPR) repeat protein
MSSRIPELLVAAALFIVSPACIRAQQPDEQHHHEHPADSGERLGTISFPTSCSAEVQAQFERGVELLYSFEYDEATKQFEDVTKSDSGCAIAYWGEAMTLYHQLWGPPSESDLAEGWKLVEKAQAAAQKSPREEEYIKAMAAFYKPGKQTMEARATAYSNAMEKLHDDYPADQEAAVFYALSLLASEPPGDTSLAYAKKSVAILNGVLAKNPDHPGVTHYLIHACDNPIMAAEGLAAAKRYASIAPASPHALHMPSHIFARLGLWQDDIASNLAAVAAAEHGSFGADERLHPMDFLVYAYLQSGQDDKARAIEAEALAVKNEGFGTGRELFYFYIQAHLPALLALETRNWKAAESLVPTPNAEPRFQAITYWAQAVGAGHLGDVPAAETAVRNLDNALVASRKLRPQQAVPPVETDKNEAHAWLAFAEKRNDDAFKLLAPVIQFQDEVGKGEVELPAREMYADMLLELGRSVEALEQYRLSLKSDPNRFNGLYGAGRAAELAHDTDTAKMYYKQLLENCNQGQGSDRPELKHARNFIAGMDAAKTP